MHNFSALILHLHFLARVALKLLAADLRDEVIGNLMGKDLRLDGPARAQSLDLLGKLQRAARTGAGNRLIGRGGH